MRRIGSLDSEESARRVVAALARLGIVADLRPAGDGAVTLWVHDEDRVPQAQEELAAFHADPQAPRFRRPAPSPKPPPSDRPRPQPAAPRTAWRRVPATLGIALAAVAATLATDFMHGRGEPLRSLTIAPYTGVGGGMIGWDGLAAVESGQVWRLVTPALLHLDPLHLIFNLMWLWLFAGAFETLRGPWRLLLVVTAVAAVSNYAEYWLDLGFEIDGSGVHSQNRIQPSPLFGGLSGVNFGLFGLIWMRARLLPGSGFAMPRDTVVWLMIWLVACTSGLVGPVANVAHAVGLLVGMAIGAAPRLWRRA